MTHQDSGIWCVLIYILIHTGSESLIYTLGIICNNLPQYSAYKILSGNADVQQNAILLFACHLGRRIKGSMIQGKGNNILQVRVSRRLNGHFEEWTSMVQIKGHYKAEVWIHGHSLRPWAFLQGIVLIQGLNRNLLHWQVDFFTTEPPGKFMSPFYDFCNFAKDIISINWIIRSLNTWANKAAFKY